MKNTEILFDILICITKLSLTLLSLNNFGLIKTFFIIFFYFKINYYILNKYFKLHRVGGPDRVLIGKSENERYNMMAVLKMKNFDVNKIKSFLIEKLIRPIPKFRSQLVNKFYTYFWQEKSLQLAEEYVKNSRIISILDENELDKIIKLEVNIHVEIFKNFPYEFLFLKYLSNETEGALIIKIDHCFTDGLGMVSLIGAISDNYSPEILPTILKRKRGFPNVFKILKDLIIAPYVFYKNKRMIKIDTILNPLKIKPSGESLIAYSKFYKFDELFNICKEMKLSFNEFIIANISAGIKLYLKNNFKPENIPKNLYITIPIGNTLLPITKENLIIRNSATVAFTQLPLIDDPICEYDKISYTLKESVGNYVIPILGKSFIDVGYEFFPNFLFEYISNTFTNSVDMCISNVPGSKAHLMYAGSEVYEIISVLNTGMIFCFGLILSYNNTIRILFSFDKLLGIKPEDVVDCVEQTLDRSKDKIKNKLH